MAKTKNISQTHATLWLDQQGVAYTEHVYRYTHHGGARHAAQELDLDLHSVAKTLIMEDEHARPMIVVMHGDQNVSTKNLARQIGVKRVTPCSPRDAERHSGYQIGGTSPFGTRKKMDLWVETGLLELDKIYVNGGRRGFLIGLGPHVLTELSGGRPIQAGIRPSGDVKLTYDCSGAKTITPDSAE